jgi:hypothetical protein
MLNLDGNRVYQALGYRLLPALRPAAPLLDEPHMPRCGIPCKDCTAVRTTWIPAFFALGCSVHTWAADSSSRRHRKFFFISRSESPRGGPDGLNRHAHSEQPQPRKCGSSIQISSRRRVILGCLAAREYVAVCGINFSSFRRLPRNSHYQLFSSIRLIPEKSVGQPDLLKVRSQSGVQY